MINLLKDNSKAETLLILFILKIITNIIILFYNLFINFTHIY